MSTTYITQIKNINDPFKYFSLDEEQIAISKN